MDIASLGWVGFTVLSLPTGTSLYSGFLASEHVMHALPTFLMALAACG